jgi:proteasome lid subunit RPN8/RPN11
VDFLRDHPPERLAIPEPQWKEMENDVASRLPEEACGLVAGRYELVCQVYPVTNVLHSPVEFSMHPQEQLDAFQKIEAQELTLLGIYHSHPQGPPGPSPSDIARAYYPGAVQLVWYLSEQGWSCRGFAIQADKIREVRIERFAGYRARRKR